MKLPKTTDAKLQAMADQLALAVGEGRSKDVAAFFQSAEVKALDGNRTVFLQSQVPYEKMLSYCETGTLPWWTVFTGRIVCGDIEGMKEVYHRFKMSDQKKPDLNAASTWGTFPFEIAPGVHVTPKAEVLAQLVQWGVKPDYDGEKYYKRCLEKSGPDIIAVFLKAGASADTAALVMKGLLDKNPAQAANIWSSIGGMAPTYLADNHILSEEEHRLEPAGLGTLRKEFDFRARRVREIYIAPKKEYTCMDSISFDEYDSADIDTAREKLIQMGGKIPERDAFSGKKRLGLKGLSGGARNGRD